jgi:hypothetical protein
MNIWAVVSAPDNFILISSKQSESSIRSKAVETDCWDPKNIKRNLVRKKGRKFKQIISDDNFF